MSEPLLQVSDLHAYYGKSHILHGVNFAVERGEISVGWFKEFMGKRWRYREGNAQLGDGDEEHVTQDEDIERLILG